MTPQKTYPKKYAAIVVPALCSTVISCSGVPPSQNTKGMLMRVPTNNIINMIRNLKWFWRMI